MLGVCIGALSATAQAASQVASQAASQAASSEKYIQSDDADLQKGRIIWLDNCESCHGYGIADAPIPMQPEQWKHRVSKQTEVLYTHAIEGFIGEDYSMMPARGGNEDLGDEEVRLAVDYMVFLARFYINKQSNER
jgi:cytochrome c5